MFDRPLLKWKVMHRLDRVRLFSIVSIVILAIVLSMTVVFHRFSMGKQIREMGEQNNVAITYALANIFWPDMVSLLQSTVPVDKQKLTAEAQIAHFKQVVADYVRNTPVVRVKLYDLNGLTVFSSQPSQIGDDQNKNIGFIAARHNQVLSEISHRDAFPTFDGTMEDRSLISSYVPLRRTAKDPIIGVFELYSDVSPLIDTIEREQWLATFGLAIILSPLLVAAILLVGRMETKIRTHEWARRRFVTHIQESHAALERRVQERTQALEESNLALRTEVVVRRQAEAELCIAASVYANTHEGIVVTDLQGKIQSVNPAFTTITGFTYEEALGKNMRMLKSGRQSATFYQEMWQELMATGRWTGEIWNRRKNGEIYPENVNISAIRDADGQSMQYVAVFSDISGLKKSEQQLQFLVHHDVLTGLPNRLLLQDRMERAFSFAARFEQMVAVLFLGIDRFKIVNETAGRKVGDLLLKAISQRLMQNLRDEDSLARIEGDEFVILATGLLEAKNAAKIARKIQATLNEPFIIGDEHYFIGVSIGISVFPFDGKGIGQYLRHAESAMSRAKDKGGGAFEYYTQEMGETSIKRLAMEKGLYHALEREEFFLHYQPQIDVITGRLTGVETLVRWHNHALGLVSPANFIPLAEENNLIIPLGEWILRSACQQGMLWRNDGYAPIQIAVNLSAKQFLDPSLLSMIQRALDDTGYDPHYLELELTEGMFMRDVQETTDLLGKLREMGLQLSIDDFGTGYSSLSYLKRFPIHTLKIDQAFIRDIIEDQDDAAITRTIIAMAKNLNLKVIAEGVASPNQLEFLRELGCDLVQGFLFSQPVPPEEITFFLEEDQMFRSQGYGADAQVPRLHASSGKQLRFPSVPTSGENHSITPTGVAPDA